MFIEVVNQFSVHYKLTVHKQTARYWLYFCEMETGQSYATRVDNLRKGLSVSLQSETYNYRNFVNDLIRDVIFPSISHPQLCRHCLLDDENTLTQVLRKRISIQGLAKRISKQAMCCMRLLTD